MLQKRSIFIAEIFVNTRVFDNMFPIDHLFDRPFIFHKRISFYKKTQLSFTIRDQKRDYWDK